MVQPAFPASKSEVFLISSSFFNLFIQQVPHFFSNSAFQISCGSAPPVATIPGQPRTERPPWWSSAPHTSLIQSHLCKLHQRCLSVTPHCLEDKVQAPSMVCAAAPPSPAPATWSWACVVPSFDALCALLCPWPAPHGHPGIPKAGALLPQDSSSDSLLPHWAAKSPIIACLHGCYCICLPTVWGGGCVGAGAKVPCYPPTLMWPWASNLALSRLPPGLWSQGCNTRT